MKKITNSQYSKMVGEVVEGSSVIIKCLKAFICGGTICVIAQIYMNFLISINIAKTDASTYTSIFMIFLGSLLTGLNIYGKIAKFGGAGTLVPITGFANAIVSPAMEFKSEGLVLGLGAKMFIIAGPVLVYGIITSVICGLLILLGRMI